MTKTAYFGPNLAVFWTKIQIFMGGIQSFGTHITENHPGTLFTFLFGRAPNGPNLAVFGPKILIFMGGSKSFGTNTTENHLDNLSALFFGQALDQMGQIWPFLCPKSNFLGAGSKNFGTLVSGFQ